MGDAQVADLRFGLLGSVLRSPPWPWTRLLDGERSDMTSVLRRGSDLDIS